MNTRSTNADADYKRKILASAPAFHTTPEDDLNEIARCGKMIAIARGKPASRSAGADKFFLIERGVIAGLQADHDDGKPVLTALFGPGDICGLQKAVAEKKKDNTKPLAEAKCLSNVSAVAIPTADLMRVARRCPELSQSLMSILAAHTDETAKLLAQSLHRPLELRLAYLFSKISDLLCQDDWRPTASAGKISQAFVGQMLGVSREHVNRTLTMWEKSGLIFQNKSGEIFIQNRKRLKALASDKGAALQSSKDDDRMWEIDSYLDLGLNQTAFHLAMEASKRTPRDMRFRHRAVLATARSGAMAEALTMIDKLGLKHDYSDEELGCLRPRILRDMAFSTEDEALKHQYLVDSAEEYAKVFDKCRKNYSGLNAAYGYAMLDDRDRARGLASIVGDITHQKLEPLDDDEDSYWLRATIAECKLLQNDLQTAATLFQSACRASDVTPGKKAATRRQLYRAAPFLNLDQSWIDRAVPQVKTMFFSGPLAGGQDDDTEDLIDKVVEDVRDYIEEQSVGWACGALASGCDLAIAETLLEAGVSLNVYLPLNPTDFMKSSVSGFGEEWRQRFTDCMRAASSIDWNRRAPHATRAAYQLGALVAMGKSIRHAEELQTQTVGFFALQKNKDCNQSLSVANLQIWEQRGLAYGETSGVWPKKQTNVNTPDTALYYALVIQGENDNALDKKADSVVVMPDSNAKALLFADQAASFDAAVTLSASPQASACRIWLDAGVFYADGAANTQTAAFENLITASCQPISDKGKIYASDVYASVAAIGLPKSCRFEYAGYTAAQEKLDPCPLYLVG